MRVVAVLGALCVFLAFLASPGGAVVVKSPPQIAPASKNMVLQRAAPGRPVERDLPEGVSVARQCPASTILSRVVDSSGMRAFYAQYSSSAFNTMLAKGCTRIQQGCNVCKVQYTGCTAEQRAACTDGDCLARVCERKTICTAKSCSAVGTKPPPCHARFVRHACIEAAFDSLDTGAKSRE